MESWKKRLSSALRDAADRSAVFVLGDGLARDSTGGFGGSGRVLEVLAQDYGIREPVAGEDVSEAKVYGRRLERLQADEGQAEVARLFRKVVLAACQLPEHDPRRHAALEPPHHLRWMRSADGAPGRLVVSTPAGMVALAELVEDWPRNGRQGHAGARR